MVRCQFILCMAFVAVCLPSLVMCDLQMDGYGNNKFSGHFTSYFWSHPKQQITKNGMMAITLTGGRTCPAIQLNFIARDGWRYASVEHFQQYANVHSKILKGMKSSAYPFINTWRNYDDALALTLGDVGRKEMQYLSQKFSSSLNDLLKKDVGSHKFTAANVSIYITSAEEFKGGLGTGKVMIDDSVLQSHKYCPYYKREVRKSYKDEQYKFEKEPEFHAVISNVEKRLKLENGTLETTDIKRIWELCATELATRNKNDWCTLLSDEDREVLQYGQDLADFRLRFRGHYFNKYLGCPLLNGMLTSMDNAVNGHLKNTSYDILDARFASYPTIASILSNLGLYKDSESLLASNYDTMKTRQFDTSKILPKSANTAFILYSCGDSANDYVLKLYVNEEDVKIPMCKSNPCPYSEFKGAIESILENCNFSERCNIGTSGSSIVGASYLWRWLVISMIASSLYF